jgi:hypothetical protein
MGANPWAISDPPSKKERTMFSRHQNLVCALSAALCLFAQAAGDGATGTIAIPAKNGTIAKTFSIQSHGTVFPFGTDVHYTLEKGGNVEASSGMIVVPFFSWNWSDPAAIAPPGGGWAPGND